MANEKYFDGISESCERVRLERYDQSKKMVYFCSFHDNILKMRSKTKQLIEIVVRTRMIRKDEISL